MNRWRICIISGIFITLFLNITFAEDLIVNTNTTWTQNTVDDYCKEAEGYWKAKDYQKAISTYKKAIEIFPNNQLPYSKLESAYLTLDKFDEADSVYKEYLDKMRKGELMRLMMLDASGKTDLAIGDLLKIIGFNPEYAPALSYLGSTYKKQGKYLRAKIYLENALDIFRKQSGSEQQVKRVEDELKDIYDKKPEASHAELKTFSNSQENIILLYPSNWFVKEEKRGDIYTVFLSREKISGSDDIFKTGISVMKFYNADQFMFDMPPNKIKFFPDMKHTSMALYIDVLCTQLIMQEKLISRTTYRNRINNTPTYISEVSFKNDFGFSETMFLVVSYKDNTFIKFVLEAPPEEFEKLYPVFKKIIDNAKLF